MKKILSILVVLAMAIVSAQVLAADEVEECCPQGCDFECGLEAEYPSEASYISTYVNVIGGGGGGTTEIETAPIIKAKWEYDEEVEVDMGECADCISCVPGTCLQPGNMYYHDACPCIPGLQVKPILGNSVTVGYYAIVTDPQGVADVAHVYADIWHPDGYFKYQIELHQVGLVDPENGAPLDEYDKTIALDIWEHAFECHNDLVTINQDWAATLPAEVSPEADIVDELEEKLAYLYYGEAELDYCQPGGEYLVGVRAHDLTNSWSPFLYNTFWYIPTSAVKVDFNMIDYGGVSVSTEKWVGGDGLMTTPTKPTVKNIGNTPVNLYVWQDDMGFSDTYGEWNVKYDARLTADGEEVYYYPYEFKGDETENTSDDFPGVRIPGVLELCTQEKLDFSIHVLKGEPNSYTGQMELFACMDYPMPSVFWNTPDQYLGSPQAGLPNPNFGP